MCALTCNLCDETNDDGTATDDDTTQDDQGTADDDTASATATKNNSVSH